MSLPADRLRGLEAWIFHTREEAAAFLQGLAWETGTMPQHAQGTIAGAWWVMLRREGMRSGGWW